MIDERLRQLNNLKDDAHIDAFKEGYRQAVIDSERWEKQGESDPNGIGQHDPGAKLDQGKVQASLLEDFSLALLEVAKVSTYGAIFYSRGGWQHVENGINRYSDAAWRHGLAKKRAKFDKKSGLLHEAQEIWNRLAALELRLREETEQDDRRTEVAQAGRPTGGTYFVPSEKSSKAF